MKIPALILCQGQAADPEHAYPSQRARPSLLPGLPTPRSTEDGKSLPDTANQSVPLVNRSAFLSPGSTREQIHPAPSCWGNGGRLAARGEPGIPGKLWRLSPTQGLAGLHPKICTLCLAAGDRVSTGLKPSCSGAGWRTERGQHQEETESGEQQGHRAALLLPATKLSVCE